MMNKYCIHCFDDASLRQIFEETSSSFLKQRTDKKMARSLNPANPTLYETWHDFKSNEEIMQVWGAFYTVVRDSRAGLQFYNEWKYLKHEFDYQEVTEGEGI